MRVRFRAALVIVLVLIGSTGYAQHVPARTPLVGHISQARRPINTLRAFGVEPEGDPPQDESGDDEVTLGYRGMAEPNSLTPAQQTIPGSFTAAMNSRFSVALASDIVSSAVASDSSRQTGYGDMTFTWYGVLTHETKWNIDGMPKLVLSYAGKMPTASVSKGLGSGFVDHTVTFEISKYLNAGRFNVSGAFANTWLGQGDGAYASMPSASAIGYARFSRFDASHKWLGQVELDWNANAPGNPASLVAVVGPVFKWNDTFSFTGGLRLGLTGLESTPRVGGYASVVIDSNLDAIGRGKPHQVTVR